MDEAQLAEQNALRKQLHQEQELLQTFQESQEEKLKAQNRREKAALDIKVEQSNKQLEEEVSSVGHARSLEGDLRFVTSLMCSYSKKV